MYNPLKHFMLASFSEAELESFITLKQDTKAKRLARLHGNSNHSRTFHSVVSAIKGLGFSKAKKQELVSDWLEEALV